jgi:hypothetical protein
MTVDGTGVGNHPRLSKRAFEMRSPSAFVTAEDWIIQPLSSGSVLGGGGWIMCAQPADSTTARRSHEVET